MTVNPQSQDIIILMQQIKQRAQRQISQDLLKINFVATLQFPNGQRPRVIVPDLKFGDLPLNIPARDQYVEIPLDFAADDYTVLAT